MSAKLDSILKKFAVSHNECEEVYEDFMPGYSPSYIDIGLKRPVKDDLLVGHRVTGTPYNLSRRQLIRRSAGFYGSSGSGKTTGVVALLDAMLENPTVELNDKEIPINFIITDPDCDVLQNFEDFDNVKYHDTSEMDEIEIWDLHADLFESGLQRPLVKDATDVEIIVIEEAEDVSPEGGISEQDLEKDEKEAKTRCWKKHKAHARKARKRASLSWNIIQNVFGFRKSILRQIKTHFVWQLEDIKQISATSKPWLMAHAYDIINAERGRCFASGEGIPQRNMIFDVAQVDKYQTSDT